MRFEIDKKEFLKGLNRVQSVSGRKTTLPILSHVLLDWQKEGLYLTATDLETAVREKLSARVEEEGKASVSAKKLFEVVRELPDQPIQIQKRDNHWIRLQCGKAVFNIAGLDPDEFPSLPAFQEEHFSRISASQLSSMIEKTVFAASNEESRYHLNGIFMIQKKLGGKETVRMVATDGHRLSLVDREGLSVRGIEKGVIIPKKAVMEIRKVLVEGDKEEALEIYFNPTHGFLKIGNSLMIVRLIDGEFPEYEQVIPKENDKKLVMSREKVYESFRRVSTMASERVEGIKLAFKKDLIEISSFNQDFGDAKEELEAAFDGPPFEVGFNARYLMEVLNAIDQEEVLFELKDEGSPGILRPANETAAFHQLAIVMPMRI